MYPLSEKVLPLRELAIHWSRDLPQRPPWTDVFNRLLQAAWKGQLVLNAADGAPMSRRRLLKLVATASVHPGILFVRDETAIPTETLDLSDPAGARWSVSLPKDEVSWTRTVVE